MDTISKMLEQCRILDETGNTVQAIAILTDAIATKFHSKLVYQRGLRFEALGDYERALRDYESAIKGGDCPAATLARGRMYSLHPSTFGLAEDDFFSIINRLPDNLDAKRHLSYLYTKWDQHGKSTAYAKEVAEASPNDPAAHLWLGECYFREKEYKLASNELLLSVEGDSSNSYAWFTLARALRSLGNAEQAKNAYERAAALDPSPTNLIGLASFLIELKEPEHALSTLTALKEQDCILTEAEALLMNGYREVAEKLLKSK